MTADPGVTLAPDVYDAGACLFAYLAMPAKAPAAADAVIVLGSKYLDVARLAGALCAQYRYPVVVFSGNRGRNTSDWPSTEAETFERIARPVLPAATRVLLETEATNTGDNIRFSLRLLAEHGIAARDFLLIQNPTMTRRALATFDIEHPGGRATAVSPGAFDDYLASPAAARSLLDDLVGNLQRILVYPQRGWQTAQPVPEAVLSAYRLLLSRGYDRQLVENQLGEKS
jgi:uncharacterized SAM-binding protein YcdF (DUF218 family)